jgi:ABC-type transport system involved in multi-copper enzyme maturation permease subunit
MPDHLRGAPAEQPARREPVPPSVVGSVARVFDLSVGQMLWSVRSLILALLLGGPILLAALIRILLIIVPRTSQGIRIGGPALFGIMMWLLYIRIIIPILGVFYGTSLIADEVDDKTLTYLFTRAIRRSAVLIGKYLAYVACTVLLVLPSVVMVFFLVVPIGGGSIGRSFPALIKDLCMLVLGLISYGAVFAWVGARLKRPLLIGLVFAFGWEPSVLLLPGFLKHATVAYYLQALVPHVMPPDSTVTVLMRVARSAPSIETSLAVLALITLTALWSAARAVETREYVLEE